MKLDSLGKIPNDIAVTGIISLEFIGLTLMILSQIAYIAIIISTTSLTTTITWDEFFGIISLFVLIASFFALAGVMTKNDLYLCFGFIGYLLPAIMHFGYLLIRILAGEKFIKLSLILIFFVLETLLGYTFYRQYKYLRDEERERNGKKE